MSGAIVFAATCPKCQRERAQEGYTVDDLARLLHAGHPIEAYCALCDEFWAVNAQKRVELAEVVAWACRGPSS